MNANKESGTTDKSYHLERGLLAAAGLLGLTSLMLSWVSPLLTLFVTVTLGVMFLIFAVAAIEGEDRHRAVDEQPEPGLSTRRT